MTLYTAATAAPASKDFSFPTRTSLGSRMKRRMRRQEGHCKARPPPIEMDVQELCPLFRLPGEIRNIIWRLLLRSSRCHYAPAPLLFYVCRDDQVHSQLRDEDALHPQIMRTCQSIYTETISILYSENIFELYRGRHTFHASPGKDITYRSGVLEYYSSMYPPCRGRSTYRTHYVPENHVSAHLVRRVAISNVGRDVHLSWHYICRLLSPFPHITHLYIRIRPAFDHAGVFGYGHNYWKHREVPGNLDLNMRVNHARAGSKPESILEAESQLNEIQYRPPSEFRYSEMPGPRKWFDTLYVRSQAMQQGSDNKNLYSYSKDEWGPISVERWVIEPTVDESGGWISNCRFSRAY